MASTSTQNHSTSSQVCWMDKHNIPVSKANANGEWNGWYGENGRLVGEQAQVSIRFALNEMIWQWTGTTYHRGFKATTRCSAREGRAVWNDCRIHRTLSISLTVWMTVWYSRDSVLRKPIKLSMIEPKNVYSSLKARSKGLKKELSKQMSLNYFLFDMNLSVYGSVSRRTFRYWHCIMLYYNGIDDLKAMYLEHCEKDPEHFLTEDFSKDHSACDGHRPDYPFSFLPT